mgnify:FL=1|tara:strand:- start:2487 stop:2729 length:243 start_codon:yes stop_codon:yes gene_type:complete
MRVPQLIQALVDSANLWKISSKEMAIIAGYEVRDIYAWSQGKKLPTLPEYVDWANSLGYEVTLIRKGENSIATTTVHSSK